MSYGGEVSVLEKINRLDSYLSEGLPRYQDILEKHVAPNFEKLNLPTFKSFC